MEIVKVKIADLSPEERARLGLLGMDLTGGTAALLEKGALLECMPVVLNERLELNAHSVVFSMGMFEERMIPDRKLEVNESAYQATVSLLKAFLGHAAKAPKDTLMVKFEHEQEKPCRRVGGGDTYKQKWICRVDAIIENGVNVLVFTDATFEREKREKIIDTKTEIQPQGHSNLHGRGRGKQPPGEASGQDRKDPDHPDA